MAVSYRLKYEKKGRMKYIGHLDLLRLFQRALRRAGLPVAYSQGFNPHHLISFASPLPIGVESAAEYVDVGMSTEIEPDNALRALNAVFPEGMTALSIRRLAEGEKTGAALAAAAKYEIVTAEPVCQEQLEEFLRRSEVMMEKRTKSGVNVVNIRPDIGSATLEEGKIIAVLSAGSMRNLKPELFVAALLGQGAEAKYTRVEIYQQLKKGWAPL